MGSLKNFFKENKVEDEIKEIVVSRNFIDDDGRPIKWQIRPLSSYEEKLIDDSITTEKKDRRTGTITTVRDDSEYVARLAAQAVVFPDLGDRELQKSYSTPTKPIRTKVELLREMLSAGELLKLSLEVSNLSGLNIDDQPTDYESDLEYAKN